MTPERASRICVAGGVAGGSAGAAGGGAGGGGAGGGGGWWGSCWGVSVTLVPPRGSRPWPR
ncbi:MAG: hypothetical protein EA352_01930 [Gemmatimonadales bacterium]|nr:MAG: hypothetical protein EA352_01930 [Gemmatimonadales bacterium]